MHGQGLIRGIVSGRRLSASRTSASRRFQMYYSYGKINRGHNICPLYGGRPLFGESVIRGFTVYSSKEAICLPDIYSLFGKASEGELIRN